MKSFWLEVKSTCKSFKFLAFILVLLCLQIVLITQFQKSAESSAYYDLQGHLTYSRTSAGMERFWQENYDYIQEHGEPKPHYPYNQETIESNLAWYKYERDLGNKILQAFESEDWPTYTRHMAEKRLLEWNIRGALVDPRNPYMPFSTPEDYFGQDWSTYSQLANMREVDQLPIYVGERLRSTGSPEHIIFSTTAYLQLLQEDLPPQTQHSTSPWGFLFNFLRQGLPRVLGIIVLLMTVNLVHQDKKYGAIKVNLLNPKGRGHYLLRKTSVGFVASLFTVALPQLAIFLYHGLGQGFRGLNLPVLMENNLWQWVYGSEHIRLIRWTPWFTSVGLSEYAPSYSGWHAIERLETVPLWQFLLLASALLLLFILFCTALGIFISTLVKSEVFAQVTAVGVFVLGTSFASIFPEHRTGPWDLFAKADVIPILEGNSFTTYLTSLVVLALATVILLLLSMLVFRRQDIAN